MIDIGTIDALCSGRFGAIDASCPACGPFRRSAQNRRRKMLRIWRDRPGFATYCCGGAMRMDSCATVRVRLRRIQPCVLRSALRRLSTTASTRRSG